MFILFESWETKNTMTESGEYNTQNSPTAETENLGTHRNIFQRFWDMTILFFGISTKENLEQTRATPIRARGLFLFRDKNKD
jgi:hypothetical protein